VSSGKVAIYAQCDQQLAKACSLYISTLIPMTFYMQCTLASACIMMQSSEIKASQISSVPHTASYQAAKHYLELHNHGDYQTIC